MTTWRDKAHKIIADECFKAWESNGRKSGYRPTATAQFFVDCLGTDDEERAKAGFIRLAYGWPVA